MADGFENDGLDDLPGGGGGSAARVVGEAARGWREAGGERGKRKTTLVTTAGKVNSTEEEELNIDTLTRFGALTRGSSVVNRWTIVDYFL